MQVSVESMEGLERRMIVELPAEMINEAVEKRLKEVSRTIKLDGFRPGKVPMPVVRRRFTGEVRQEIFGNLVQSSYFEALSQEKLQPAGEPAIEPIKKPLEEGMPYTYAAVFEVMPEITLNDMSSSIIKRPVVEVTEADLQAVIEKLRKQRATWNDVERGAGNDDQITINFKGYINGEAFDGGSADGVPLILGSNDMIDGFEEGLRGAKAGENRTLELTFPENYQADALAGKAATFEVEIAKVAEPVLPDVDDEFVKAFGVTKGGVEALHKEIRGNMERELEENIRGRLKEQVMDILLEVNPIEVPQALVRQESNALREQTKLNMAQSGQSSNIDLPIELFEEQARKRVALGLVMHEMIKLNNIQLDAGRVRAKVEQFAHSYETPQEVIDYYYSNKEQLAGVENVVVEEQLVDWVLEQAKVEDTDSGFDEVMNPPVKEATVE
ncbi:trigger factor [Candidatus Vondammii sp. HM_W22]|uniref:trigger factor n=1 Tax=Candidatus Vondammii sp. HM_W22 TaxID=2687299 RepID=UPI001F12E220|nr:trigger factor [Candidatus Vondammii sp. HM_W22]